MNEHFIKMAKEVSYLSADPSTKIGVVLIDEANSILNLGVNKIPDSIKGVDIHNREEKYKYIVHGEMDALLTCPCQPGQRKHAIYIWGLPPCASCALSMVHAGIKEVYYACDEIPERWKESTAQAALILTKGGVHFERIFNV